MLALNTDLQLSVRTQIWFKDSRVLPETLLLTGTLGIPANAPESCHLHNGVSPSHSGNGHLVLVIYLCLVCWLGLDILSTYFLYFLQCDYCLRKPGCKNITQQKVKQRIHFHYVLFLSLSICLVQCKPTASTILISQYLRVFGYCFRNLLQGFFFSSSFWLSHFCVPGICHPLWVQFNNLTRQKILSHYIYLSKNYFFFIFFLCIQCFK